MILNLILQGYFVTKLRCILRYNARYVITFGCRAVRIKADASSIIRRAHVSSRSCTRPVAMRCTVLSNENVHEITGPEEREHRQGPCEYFETSVTKCLSVSLHPFATFSYVSPRTDTKPLTDYDFGWISFEKEAQVRPTISRWTLFRSCLVHSNEFVGQHSFYGMSVFIGQPELFPLFSTVFQLITMKYNK